MGLFAVLLTVVAFAFVVLAGFAVFGILEFVKTMRATREVLADVHEQLPVVLEDADVSLNALTLELMRVDGILDDIEHVSDTAAQATRAAEEAVQVPLQKAAAYAERVRKALSSARGKK